MRDSIKRVLLYAAKVVDDRDGDVCTRGGPSYATTSTDSIIELQAALADAFSNESDDVNYREVVAIIKEL